MHMSNLHACMSIHYLHGLCPERQKKASALWVLDLQIPVRCHVVLKSQTQSSRGAVGDFNSCIFSLGPLSMIFKRTAFV